MHRVSVVKGRTSYRKIKINVASNDTKDGPELK